MNNCYPLIKHHPFFGKCKVYINAVVSSDDIFEWSRAISDDVQVLYKTINETCCPEHERKLGWNKVIENDK